MTSCYVTVEGKVEMNVETNVVRSVRSSGRKLLGIDERAAKGGFFLRRPTTFQGREFCNEQGRVLENYCRSTVTRSSLQDLTDSLSCRLHSGGRWSVEMRRRDERRLRVQVQTRKVECKRARAPGPKLARLDSVGD